MAHGSFMARRFDTVFLDSVHQSVAGNPEKTGCSCLIPGIAFQSRDHYLPLQLLKGIAAVRQRDNRTRRGAREPEFVREFVESDSVAVPHDK